MGASGLTYKDVRSMTLGTITKLIGKLDQLFQCATGVEMVDVAAGTSTIAAVHLNSNVAVSVLLNQTGAARHARLADGKYDGQIHEVASGATGPNYSNAIIYLESSNGYGNDALDLSPNNSVRLVWSQALLGWAVLNYCTGISNPWD